MSDAAREAAEAGDIAFFERRGKIDDRDEFGQTAILVAANNGRLELVRWLLDQGADPEGHTFDCEVKYYLNANARADLRGRWTLLHAAAQTASIEMIAFLIDQRGYDVHARDDGGWTPLHVLVRYPFASVEGIDALLARGADVNALDALGQNTLCKARDAEIARYLIEKGAHVDGGDHVASMGRMPIGSDPERPIDRFALANDLEMVEDLLARGATPTSKTLQTALFNGNAALVERLLPLLSGDDAASALVHADQPGLFEQLLSRVTTLPPMSVYMAAGTPWKLRAVLARGAPVDEPNAEGWTALHYAVRAGDRETLQLLLDHEANIHAKLPNGQTALHLAADAGNLEMVKLFLELGADPSAIAGKKTPRALAYGRGTPQHDAVAQFLEPLTKLAAPPPVAAAPMAVGSSVSHPKFGTGTVVSREGDKLRVKFEGGEKVLLARVLTAT
jgi:ankyrin repeat protein